MNPHATPILARCFACFIIALALAKAQDPIIVRDDFDDGTLGEEWTRFPNDAATTVTHLDGRVRFQAANSGFAGLDREDISLSEFYVAIDLIDWDPSFNPIFGLATRTQPGSSGGYVCQYGGLLPEIPEGGFSIRKFGNNGDDVLSVDTSVRFEAGRSYRILFTGKGTHLTAKVYGLEDLESPLSQIETNDSQYASGFVGIYGLAAPPNKVDVTIDRFLVADSAAYVPEPSAPLIIRDHFDRSALSEVWEIWDDNARRKLADPVDISFPNGALRIHSQIPHSPSRPPIGAVILPSPLFTDFYVAYDLVDWEDELNQDMGLAIRTREEGSLETVDNYNFIWNSQTKQFEFYDSVNGNKGLPLTGTTVDLDPNEDYRFVLEARGDTLIGFIYELKDLTTPLATIFTDEATKRVPGKIGFYNIYQGSFGPDRSDCTIDNFLLAESNLYAGLLLEGATAHGVEGAAQVIEKSPATGAEPIDAVDGLQFIVGTLTDKAVGPSSITLTLNGEDVSDSLTTTPIGNNLVVHYNGLQPNQSYEGSLTMANVDGVGTTHAFSFQTTGTPLPPVIIRDNFDDGELDGAWVKWDPWRVSGHAEPMEITFEDGAICLRGRNHMPNVTEIGLFRNDVDWEDFYVAVDVLEWLPNGSFTGLVARAENYRNGPNTLNSVGGFLDHWEGQGFEGQGIDLVTRLGPTSDFVGRADAALNPTQGYRLVCTGEGPNLTVSHYDLRDLTSPIRTATTDRGDALEQGSVGITMWSPFEIKASFDNFITAESDPYAGLLPDGATAHGVEGAAQVIDKSPATGSEPIDAIDGLQFTVSTLTDKAVDVSSILLTLNGEDVSENLTTMPDGNNLTVRYDGLQPNQSYEGSLMMANIDGVGSTHEFSFESTDTPPPPKIIRDDFDDGVLGDEWGFYDPFFLSGQARKMEITFESGAVKLYGPNWIPGESNVGIYRKDVEFEDFYVAVDVLDWERPGNQQVGSIARAAGLDRVGVLPESALWATIDDARGVNTPSPVGIGLFDVEGRFNFTREFEPGPDHRQSYRLVFTGSGSTVTSTLYCLEDLTAPITVVTTDQATNPAPGTVGFVTWSGFETGATIDNFIAAESNPYAGLLPDGATAHGVEGAAQVIDKSPATGSESIEAINGLQFTVSTLTDKAVDLSSIELTLNGEDVSDSLTTTPVGDNLTVRYDGLQPDQSYEGSLTVANEDGVGSTHAFTFETNDTPLPELPKEDPPLEAFTDRFNPVIDHPSLAATSLGGEVRLDWQGGGYLEKLQEQTLEWETVALESPHEEPPNGTGLFRVRDPWEGGRSVDVHIPASYDPKTPMPLVVLLHGYHNVPSYIESFLFNMKPLSESKRFIYVQPNGLKDNEGNHFWNAVVGCCGETDSKPDDAQYLRAVIEGIIARYHVDRQRIYVVGHSNGGAMANTLACRFADLIAGFVNFAGFTNKDESLCVPSEPVHALHIGGTNDPRFANDTIPGGTIAPSNAGPEVVIRPSVLESHATWGVYNQHSSEVVEAEATLDLASSPSGIDTRVTRMTGGAAGGATELWTIEGAGHTPNPTRSGTSTTLAESVIDWLLGHPKPSSEAIVP